MTFAAIISETNEYEYYVLGASEDDILGTITAINPYVTSDNFTLKRGPVQIQVKLQSLCELTHGQPHDSVNVSFTLIPYSGQDNVEPSSEDLVCVATIREQRVIGYSIDVDAINELDSVLSQLNPSNPVLPPGVSILVPLQGSTVQPTVCQRADGSYMNLYF